MQSLSLAPGRVVRRLINLDSVRVAVALLTLAVTLFVVSGCERRTIAPPLIEVTEITPRQIEPGDHLEVHGAGFPQGRSGRVELEGSLFRPGETAQRGVTIEASGTVSAPDRLEIVVRDSLAERFCGRGDHAVHATFRGDLRVAFASNNPDAPPLVGVLRGVTLDVQPSSARTAFIDARASEGKRLLDFLGITPSGVGPRGIPIEGVQSGSIAERAGLVVGDVITSVDGVNAQGFEDVTPASARSTDLMVRHVDSEAEEPKTISLMEYSADRVPVEYAPALIIVGLAICVLLILVLPGPASLATLEQRVASRMRSMTVRALAGSLFGGARDVAFTAITTAIVASFALTPYVIGREVDGVVLLLLASGLLVWSRVVMARGFLRSLALTAQVGIACVIMAGALALVIVDVGAIELPEIVRSQGVMPWQWSGARHPSSAVLAITFGAAVLAVLRVRPAALGIGQESKRPSYADGLERTGLLIASALFVIAFLGGWQAGQRAPTMGSVLGAAGLYVLKTWLVAGSFRATSSMMSSYRPSEVLRLSWKKLIPALLLAGGLIALARRVAPSTPVETAFGVTLVALMALFVIRLIARVRAAVIRPEPHASPFL